MDECSDETTTFRNVIQGPAEKRGVYSSKPPSTRELWNLDSQPETPSKQDGDGSTSSIALDLNLRIALGLRDILKKDLRAQNIASPMPFSLPFRLSHPKILCTSPTLRNRYDRNIVICMEREKHWTFNAMETRNMTEIGNWISFVHPEGLLYYLQPRAGNRFQFLTEAYLLDPATLVEVEVFADEFEQSVTDEQRTELSGHDIEVVLQIEADSWSYYMVDHERQCLFWLSDFDATWIAERIGGVNSKLHLKSFLDHEYWRHVEHFPNHRVLPETSFEKMRGVLLHGCIDSMTSDDSTMPYAPEESRILYDLASHLKELSKKDIGDGCATASLARLMSIFASERFHHFSGHRGARLTRTQSVRGQVKGQRTFLIKALSFVLFRAPDTHLKDLDEIWVDDTIQQYPWKLFVEKLVQEWEQLVLYSTVLLNANVAFLALPNVTQMIGQDTSSVVQTTPAYIASQVSMIMSLGSIIIGLLLVRQHRLRREKANEAASYLHKRTHPRLGLETLAIMYSLPYALLIWGMVTFILATAVTSFNSQNLAQLAINSSSWIFVVFLIAWTVATGWESSSNSSWKPLWCRDTAMDRFSFMGRGPSVFNSLRKYLPRPIIRRRRQGPEIYVTPPTP